MPTPPHSTPRNRTDARAGAARAWPPRCARESRAAQLGVRCPPPTLANCARHRFSANADGVAPHRANSRSSIWRSDRCCSSVACGQSPFRPDARHFDISLTTTSGDADRFGMATTRPMVLRERSCDEAGGTETTLAIRSCIGAKSALTILSGTARRRSEKYSWFIGCRAAAMDSSRDTLHWGVTELAFVPQRRQA